MGFILSNKYFEGADRIDSYYILGNYTRKSNHILIFKGFIYPDSLCSTDSLLDNLIKNGIDNIRSLKGYFCGIYINLETKKLFFFTDKIGYYDLFYTFENDVLIISNSFAEISKISKINNNDVDKVSLLEFIIFEYPLFNKTFFKKIKFVPLGTIIEYDLNLDRLNEQKYYEYLFIVKKKFNLDEEIEYLDDILDKSIQKIKKLYGSRLTYGLGLSGGMDSRLVAYYALKHDLKIKSFIFGQSKSDAYYVSRKIAEKLNIDHSEVGYKADFFKYSEKSIKYNPMMNLLYTWYYAVYNDLPKFDILLTGFNGDNQFGSHLKKSDINIKTSEKFIERILNQYCELGNIDNVLAYWNDKKEFFIIKEQIKKFCIKSKNKLYWQKKEEFNYKNRQRIFIKNNPSFNYFGLYDSISPFIDPDLINYLMGVPFEYKLHRKFFIEFLKKINPILLEIRPERKISYRYNNKLIKMTLMGIRKIDNILGTNFLYKKSHKPIHRWLINDQKFINFINNIFSKENKIFMDVINQELLKKLIKEKKWNLNEILLIFRLVTIKLFLDGLPDY